MSKGLEAIKEIELKWQYGVFTFLPNFEIIEKDLEEYEKLQGMHEELAISYNKLCEEKMKWLKSLEILEIIKDKRVNVDHLHFCINLCANDKRPNESALKTYNEDNDSFDNDLTETEFNLIKEWLENESNTDKH